MRVPVELTSAFRAKGLEVIPQRQPLFKLLHGHTGHPTAEALFVAASDQPHRVQRHVRRMRRRGLEFISATPQKEQP